MHDPLTLAFVVPGPWLRRDYNGNWRWGALLDVWHHDPSGEDTVTCNLRKSKWKWHIHHYKIKVLPWRRFKRRYLTRCQACGQKDRSGKINVSRTWYHTPEKWWQGEKHLYHSRGRCYPEDIKEPRND